MSEASLNLWRIVDGKTGHENQSLALVENLQALAPFHCVNFSREEWTRHRQIGRSCPPALVLGAGHRTHRRILSAARRYHCPSVVIMKPSIPPAFFDLCLIPEHDLSGPPADNVVATRGMLNRIPAKIPPKEAKGLILIGGPSRHHRWSQQPLSHAIKHLVETRPEGYWTVADSRRTPPDFATGLAQLGIPLQSATETGPNWLPTQLVAAREVWVTEDSMSMIYEALTAQARVGLLPMPRISKRSRIVRGIDRLVADGWTRFFDSSTAGDLAAPPETIHEASRCARELLQRFFPALV